MIDILPAQVRNWVTRLSDDGVSPTTIAASKTILGAIFTTALNDQVVFLHPCRGSQDSPGTEEDTDNRDSGTVRDDLRGDRLESGSATRRDSDRNWTAVGGARRAPPRRPSSNLKDADGQPDGG